MLRHPFRGSARAVLAASTGRRFAATAPGPANIQEYLALGDQSQQDKVMEAMFKKYGNTNTYPAGALAAEPVLQVHHPRDIETVFRNEGKNPTGAATRIPALNYFFEKYSYTSSLGSAVDEEWRTIRGALQKRLFSPKEVVDYLPILNPVFTDLGAALPAHGSDVSPHLSNATFDLINTVLFGSPLGVGSDEANASPEDKDYVAGARFIFSDLKLLLGDPATIVQFTKDPEQCAPYKSLETNMLKIMNHGQVLLDRCLSSMEEEGPEGDAARISYVAALIKAGKLSRDGVVTNVLGFLFAGIDTTSAGLNWIMYHMATNPEQQAALRRDIRKSFGSKPGEALPMTATEWAKCPELKWAIKEMFRMSIVTLGTARMMPHDFEVDGIQVKAGDQVQLTPFPYHRDERIWGADANSFRYTRWDRSEKVKPAEGEDPRVPSPSWKHDPFLSIHFSRGPRMCIGARLAEIEMAGWLAEALQRYQIELADDSPRDITADFTQLLGRPHPQPTYKFTPATE